MKDLRSITLCNITVLKISMWRNYTTCEEYCPCYGKCYSGCEQCSNEICGESGNISNQLLILNQGWGGTNKPTIYDMRTGKSTYHKTHTLRVALAVLIFVSIVHFIIFPSDITYSARFNYEPQTGSFGSCSAMYRDRMLIFGGFESDSDDQISQVTDCELQRVGSLPKTATFPACSTFNNAVWICFAYEGLDQCIRLKNIIKF